MKRTIFLKLEVDWEEFTYEGISDTLLLEDTGILDNLKDGVSIERVNNPYQYKIDFTLANPNYLPPPPAMPPPRLIREGEKPEPPPSQKIKEGELPIAMKPALRPFTQEELDAISNWLQSDEGKRKMKEGQENAEKIIDKLRDIDPKILREPFNI